MALLSYVFLVLVLIELSLLILVATNFFSLFPINFHEFAELPAEVREDVTDNVKAIIDDYKNRLSRNEALKPTEKVLYLRFHVQNCQPGEKPPRPHELWPAGWIHVMCGSEATLEWCWEDMDLYKTSEKKLTFAGGQELHVGVSCYRTKEFNRILHDNDNNLLLIAGCVFPLICLIKLWVLYREQKDDDDEEARRIAADAQAQVVARRRFATGPRIAPRHNIVSRRDNYRNRRN